MHFVEPEKVEGDCWVLDPSLILPEWFYFYLLYTIIVCISCCYYILFVLLPLIITSSLTVLNYKYTHTQRHWHFLNIFIWPELLPRLVINRLLDFPTCICNRRIKLQISRTELLIFPLKLYLLSSKFLAGLMVKAFHFTKLVCKKWGKVGGFQTFRHQNIASWNIKKQGI